MRYMCLKMRHKYQDKKYCSFVTILFFDFDFPVFFVRFCLFSFSRIVASGEAVLLLPPVLVLFASRFVSRLVPKDGNLIVDAKTKTGSSSLMALPECRHERTGHCKVIMSRSWCLAFFVLFCLILSSCRTVGSGKREREGKGGGQGGDKELMDSLFSLATFASLIWYLIDP
jgi:hypothetical protein